MGSAAGKERVWSVIPEVPWPHSIPVARYSGVECGRCLRCVPPPGSRVSVTSLDSRPPPPPDTEDNNRHHLSYCSVVNQPLYCPTYAVIIGLNVLNEDPILLKNQSSTKEVMFDNYGRQ